MEKRIIYSNEDRSLGIIVPSPNSPLSVTETADKDVPTGRPYKIVDVSDIPEDRSSRRAWTADDTDLDDGVGQ